MDDFIIPAKTIKELEEMTIRFLKIAEKHNLCFKRSKYNFNMEEIPILGVVVGKGQIQMEQERAFKELKEKITSQPVLALSRKKGKFRVKTDASGHAIGGVLSQVSQTSFSLYLHN